MAASTARMENGEADGTAMVGAGAAVGDGAVVGVAAAGVLVGAGAGAGEDGGRSGLGHRIGTTPGYGTIRRRTFTRTHSRKIIKALLLVVALSNRCEQKIVNQAGCSDVCCNGDQRTVG